MLQYITVRCSVTVRCSLLHLHFARAIANVLQFADTVANGDTLQHIATTLQHTLEVLARMPTRQITHCNTLQHTATHCNTLQHTATHCNTILQHTLQVQARMPTTRQHIATHFNVV